MLRDTDRLQRWPARVTLVLLTFLAHASSFSAGIVLDAKGILLDDPRIRQATSANIGLILRRTYWWPTTEGNLYRPITTLSYLLNYAVLGGQGHAFGYHVVNLGLHLANVLLVYALSLRLSRRFWPSFFIAALWAVHPLTTEAVANLVGRADLLAGFGVLASLYAYVHSTRSLVASGFSRTNDDRTIPRQAATGPGRAKSGFGRKASGFNRAEQASTPTADRSRMWWFVSSVGLAALGMLSKESAVACVAIIVMYDVFFRIPQVPIRALAGRWVAFLLPLAGLLYVRSLVVLPGLGPPPFVDNPIVTESFWRGRLTALSVAGRYLRLFLWPGTLSSDYSYGQIPAASGGLSDWAAWVSVAAIVIAAIVLLVRSVRIRQEIARVDRARAKGPGLRSVPKPMAGDTNQSVSAVPLAGFALAFACIAFLPVSNLLFATGTIMAERLMYLPSVGLVASLVIALLGVARLAKVPPAAPVIVAVLVVALGARTFARNLDWRDDVTLWKTAVRVVPDSFKAHQGLADSLYEADANHHDLDTVIDESERSIAILDPVADAMNVPMAYRRAAGYQLEKGDALRASGGPGDAAASTSAYERSVARTLRYLAIVKAKQPTTTAGTPRASSGNASGGDAVWDLSEAYVMLATGYSRLHDIPKGLDAVQRAQALQPFNSVPYRVMASLLVDTNRLDEAAVWLLAGFSVTGDAELRQAVIDLYQHGGDPKGCALKTGGDGPLLNPACDTVRRELCGATSLAMEIQARSGHQDLSDQLRETLKGYGCDRP